MCTHLDVFVSLGGKEKRVLSYIGEGGVRGRKGLRPFEAILPLN